MSKVRKVYNLRKTANLRQQSIPEESRVSENKDQQDFSMKVSDVMQKNVSVASQLKQFPSKIFEQQQEYQVDGEELSVDRLQINFNVPICDISKDAVKVKNIGNSAVYVKFNFLNNPRINVNGFKDTKAKFYCHHENTVIKPGEEVSFIFSFISQFPGNFTEQVEICCQPSLKTPIPNLKLNGNAFIKDQSLSKRKDYNSIIDEVILKNQVRQILADLVANVKLPPPPLPDIKNPKVAQIQFQCKNKEINLYYNEYLHGWFNELYNQICEKGGKSEEDRYWDQSVSTLRNMIENADYLDEVEQKCFKDRLQHYCYLGMAPLPNKSELYQTVYEFVSTAAYNLGGDYVDAVKKELDMWEVPFRQPLESDTEVDLKTRKEEVDRIKGEWLKKAKKKKWGQQEQKQMINQFKKKVQQKTTEDIINRFDNFQQGAQFIKTRQMLKKSTFKLQDHHKYLQRIKTVRQCPLDGKKVMIKWNLKLKDNCQDKLKQMSQYLTKKKQFEKRLEEEKKDGGKKKKVAKPKKKGQKEEEEEKPLVFDFMGILDEENWNGFTQTFKTVMEKQPFLVIIGITYGPRVGRYIAQHSVQFLLEHLKTLESAIEWFPHEQLSTLKEKIQNQTIGEGSILLMENLNFLPWEVTRQEIVDPPAEEGGEQIITKRKLLQPQIRQFFDDFGESIDVIVNEDRFLNQLSGFTAYLNKQVLMGTQWWRYVGLSMRVTDSTLIFGGDFSAECYLLLSRLACSVREIRLTGKIGAKFYLLKNNIQKLGNICLGNAQKQAMNNLLAFLQQQKLSSKINIPCDFCLKKVTEDQTETMNFDGSQENTQGWQVVDIGEKTVEEICCIRQGNLFVLGETAISVSKQVVSSSLTKILRGFFKKQEAKKERHAQQSSTSAGIDYNEDLVIYLVGLDQQLVEKVQLKQKKLKSSEQEQQQAGEQQQQGEGDRRRIELVSDFRLSFKQDLYRLWCGRFEVGLRDVSKYDMIVDV